MIRIAIVEDEASASAPLHKFLDEYCQKNNLAAEVKVFDNPVTFLEAFKANFDILFLDIVMPDMDGIRLAHKIRESDGQIPIIFVTNMKQFAIQGYEVEALDFIVKPVAYYDFEIAFRRALRKLESLGEEFVYIPVKGGAKRIPVSDIRYIETAQHKLIWHLSDGQVEAAGNLKDIEQSLYAYGLRRCNHCYLVNMRYVTQVLENSILLGPDEEELQISRSKKKTFLSELSKYWGG